MLRLVYVSRSKKLLTAPDIKDLLRVSRRKNERSEVTGILLYEFARFMQVLEGPAGGVEELMERIERDERHTDVQVLLREEAVERYFDGWQMGFSERPDLRRRDRALVSSFLDRSELPTREDVDARNVRRMARAFRSSVRKYV